MSDSRQQLDEVFRAALNLPASAPVAGLRREQVPAWDSMAHVNLMLALESVFGISVGPSEALQLVSYDATAAYLRDRGHAV